MARPRKTSSTPKTAQSYRHAEADLAARPEIGAQAHFKMVKPPTKYRFDSSLAPSLEWDGQNSARETAEHLIAQLSDLGLRAAALAAQPASNERDRELTQIKAQSAPFPAGEHGQIAVKVIDPRGNELLVVKKLERGQ